VTEKNQGVAAIIKSARAIKGLSQSELARRVGTSQQTIDKIETGTVQRSSYMAAIAVELGVPLDRVMRVPQKTGSVEIPGHVFVTDDRDLPIYGVAQGENGAQVLSLSPVEYVLRPQPLARVRDAYSVIIADDLMAPEAGSGDIAFVNPHIPPRGGDTCVFRSSGEGGARFGLKRLRKVTEKDWQVSEWSGADGARHDFILKRAEWPIAHVTVGYFKRR
jgi:transcriptional regulator with XRE-family HTH domain